MGEISIIIDFPNPTEEEKKAYLDAVEKEHGTLLDISEIHVKDVEGKAEVHYKVKGSPRFERIRRITGYLSGDITSWNDAKRAEERERVKHA